VFGLLAPWTVSKYIEQKEWVKIREIQVAMEADLPDEMELYEESLGED
jgi:hypothetical protein